MKVLENFDLVNYNGYKIQATCKRAFFPTNEEEFISIYKDHKNDLRKIILGGGYNVILKKRYYENDFILIGDSFSEISLLGENTIVCQAGVDTKTFSEYALSLGLSGAEIFYDIPSSMGGAVVMNAGASGEELKDLLVKVRYLDLVDMEVKEMNHSDIGFEYRNSFFQKNLDKIVLKVWLKLTPKSPELIKEKMEKIRDQRWAKQPRNFPNCGSVFKRPKGFYVGAMVEELGLKGFSIGGAQISEKHAGFIINVDNANGEDILNIIKEVKERVKNKFGVDLEVEQRVI